MKLHELPAIQSHYEEHGWVIIKDFYDSAHCERIKYWLNEVKNMPKEEMAFTQPVFEPQTLSTGTKVLKKVRRLFWFDPTFWEEFLTSSGTIDFLKNFKSERLALLFHAAFFKPKLVGSRVNFHQDQVLWKNYYDAINFWIALDTCTPSNGCLQVFDKSHLQGIIEHESHIEHGFIPKKKLLGEPICLEMEVGDVVIWHPLLIHGSDLNKSEEDRTSMVMVFSSYTDEEFWSKDKHIFA